jgi:hypothetical protein
MILGFFKWPIFVPNVDQNVFSNNLQSENPKKIPSAFERDFTSHGQPFLLYKGKVFFVNSILIVLVCQIILRAYTMKEYRSNLFFFKFGELLKM